MQQKEKMHPDDLRNLIIFGLCSILLWMAYDHFVLAPQKQKMQEARKIEQQLALVEQKKQGFIEETEQDVDTLLAAQTKQGTRLAIENAMVKGSINLVGARLDNLSLKQYFETVEKKKNVTLLYPMGTAFPNYIEQGWVSPDQNLIVPDSKSLWRVVEGHGGLSPDHPVVLQWRSPQNIVFEQKISLSSDYMFTFEKRVINNSNSIAIVHPYSLVARRGLPKDFINRAVVHEGPIGYFGDEMFEEMFGGMKKEPLIVKTADQGWAGLTTKDWHTAVIPPQNSESKFRLAYTKGATQKVKDLYQADFTGAAQTIAAGQTAILTTHAYAGAKKLSLLDQYQKDLGIKNFDLAVDFGLFFFLTYPFFLIINFFFGLVGNFGVAILMFVVCLRILMYPLANTSFKSFANMKKIGPQMTEMRTKYADDKQKLQQELVKLYQREKVNPMAGCLPILIQIPIFFSLFKVLSNTIEMRHAPFFGWIQDLSAPDPTTFWNLFGLLPWDGFSFLQVGVWPCLMLITMLFQKTLSPPPADKMQAQIFALMPWVMTLVLAQFAAGLVIYWTFNNLLSTLQQYVIMRRMGVDVDIIGNILGRTKPEATPIAGVHPEAAFIEEKVEEALGIDQTDTPENNVSVSKPKPKKSKKKK